MSEQLKHTTGVTFDIESFEIKKCETPMGRVYNADHYFGHYSPAQIEEINARAVANGVLWAGSPGLLAACRLAVTELQAMEDEGFPCPALAQCKAAIANATTTPKEDT
jgi:hypothetical protein